MLGMPMNKILLYYYFYVGNMYYCATVRFGRWDATKYLQLIILIWSERKKKMFLYTKQPSNFSFLNWLPCKESIYIFSILLHVFHLFMESKILTDWRSFSQELKWIPSIWAQFGQNESIVRFTFRPKSHKFYY